MKKATKAAIFVTAAAALYGAAAYGVTRTLMDVAMKRETLKFPATTEEVQSLLKNIGVDGGRPAHGRKARRALP